MNRSASDKFLHFIMRPLTFFTIGLILISISCKKENTDYSIQDLLGTWEFIAFGASDGSLREVQKYESYHEDAYTITFYEDTTMTGRSVMNTLAKKFILSGNKISFPWGVAATEIGEIGDPNLFTEALINVSSFMIKENQLKMYYSGGSFLLFNFKTL